MDNNANSSTFSLHAQILGPIAVSGTLRSQLRNSPKHIHYTSIHTKMYVHFPSTLIYINFLRWHTQYITKIPVSKETNALPTLST